MEQEQLTLGIGTRLQHTQYGPGVIVGVKYAVYMISFINHGIKEIDKTDPQLDEIIPENVTPEVETVSDTEKSLLKILRLWGDVTEKVPLGDRWTGGTMLLQHIIEAQRDTRGNFLSQDCNAARQTPGTGTTNQCT